MASGPKFVSDGTSDWSGGFDSGRSPSFIDKNQVALAINTSLPDSFGGISNRPGFRNLEIQFSSHKTRDIFENGNFQGEGYYFDGFQYHLLCSVDGWIFDFKLINNLSLVGQILNPNNQNNPNNLCCWISQVPFGAIVSDGESPNFYIFKGSIRRVTGKKEMPPSLMGVYVQNRFCYVMPDRQNIWVSDINNPVGIEEIFDDNIFGFMTPEPQYLITAIGKQKTILDNATGGNLAWSTNKTQYSVNIIGARTVWGTIQGVGMVNNTITDVGAVSSYSYEPFNGNIYFRNANFGLSSIKLAEYQFINQDTFFTGSPEANLFFHQDNEILLSKCYTRGHGSRIYTTIAPQLRDGFIYHNGIIVYAPNEYYASNIKANRRFESVYTGLRPWAITTLEDSSSGQMMFVWSYDYDGKNRIYLLDDTLDHDINKNQERVEIKSKILTRAYTFGNDFESKKGEYAFYSLKDIPRDLKVKIYTRTSEHGKLLIQWEIVHKALDGLFVTDKSKNTCFIRKPVHPVNKDEVIVSRDPTACDGDNYFIRQDLFTFEGAFTLRRWARVSLPQDFNKTPLNKEPNAVADIYEGLRIYDYKISK